MSEYENFKLNGFVGLPTYTRSTGTEQHLFVNGRYIKDKMLTGAIRGAYQGLIGHDSFPVLALFLSVPNDEVDVNVHPAKLEVRFSDVNAFYAAMARLFDRGEMKDIIEDTNERYGTKIRSAYKHNNEDLCIVHISLIYESDE